MIFLRAVLILIMKWEPDEMLFHQLLSHKEPSIKRAASTPSCGLFKNDTTMCCYFKYTEHKLADDSDFYFSSTFRSDGSSMLNLNEINNSSK